MITLLHSIKLNRNQTSSMESTLLQKKRRLTVTNYAYVSQTFFLTDKIHQTFQYFQHTSVACTHRGHGGNAKTQNQEYNNY